MIAKQLFIITRTIKIKIAQHAAICAFVMGRIFPVKQNQGTNQSIVRIVDFIFLMKTASTSIPKKEQMEEIPYVSSDIFVKYAAKWSV